MVKIIKTITAEVSGPLFNMSYFDKYFQNITFDVLITKVGMNSLLCTTGRINLILKNFEKKWKFLWILRRLWYCDARSLYLEPRRFKCFFIAWQTKKTFNRIQKVPWIKCPIKFSLMPFDRKSYDMHMKKNSESVTKCTCGAYICEIHLIITWNNYR